MRPLSIRVRLILLVLAVLLPAGGLAAWAVFADSHNARDAALVGLAAFLAGLALSYRIASSIVKPIRALAGISTQVANGDLGARARVAGPPELELVARQFNHML